MKIDLYMEDNHNINIDKECNYINLQLNDVNIYLDNNNFDYLLDVILEKYSNEIKLKLEELED